MLSGLNTLLQLFVEPILGLKTLLLIGEPFTLDTSTNQKTKSLSFKELLSVNKCKKWKCKICEEKQSIIKVYGQGSGADCRGHVQKLNMMQGEATQAAEVNACGQEDEFPEEILPQDDCLSINSQRTTDAGPGLSRWSKFLQNSTGEPGVEEGLVDEEENVYTDKDQFYTEKRVIKRSQRKHEKGWNSCNPSLEESVNSDHCEFGTRWKKARYGENWGKKDLTSSRKNAGQPLPPPKATANGKTSLSLKDSTIPEYCPNNSEVTASKWERFLSSTTRGDRLSHSIREVSTAFTNLHNPLSFLQCTRRAFTARGNRILDIRR